MRGDAKLIVTAADTARALGSGAVDVLGTPRLVALCEEATVNAVGHALDDGTSTVGMSVQFDHLQPTPVGAEVFGVETTREMLAAVLDLLSAADAVLCAAAVADYRPARPSERKLKRGEMDSGIELVENPDIAAEVGERRGKKPCAIFALETEDGVARARAKLERKNADVCVLNSPDAIGASEEIFTLVRRDGTVVEWDRITKAEVARRLLDELGL